jgi:alpha-ketoglutarate-dependent taurine dioxygenase
MEMQSTRGYGSYKSAARVGTRDRMVPPAGGGKREREATVVPQITRQQWSDLEVNGFARLTIPDAGALMAIAEALGTPVPARRGDGAVTSLTPTRVDGARPRSLSALHGTGSFPFHTDAAHHRVPPRYVVMRCARAGPSGRATLLTDFAALELSDRDIRALQRAVWMVRSGMTAFLASVLAHANDGRLVVRFDAGCMKPSTRSALEGRAILEAALSRAEPARINWRDDDGVLIDNWRVLHARESGTDNDAGVRVLQRVLIRGGRE